MKPLSELTPTSSRSIMIIGESGTGKTCFLTTCPRPLEVHDFDGKTSSAFNFLQRQGKPLDGIAVEDYSKIIGRDANDTVRLRMATFYTWLVAQEKLVMERKPLPFATVAIDSTTKFFETMLKDIVRASIGKVKPTMEGRDDMPGLSHYGVLGVDGKGMLNRVLALPCVKVFTAHYEREKDELTGRVVSQAMLPGKQLPNYLPIVFNEVYRSFVEDGKYKLQTQSDASFNCRSELGLPRVVESSYEVLAKASLSK